MQSKVEQRELESSPEIALKVQEAQVRLLYQQSWVALIGIFVVSLLLAVSLWNVLPPWKLSLWLAVVSMITLARIILTISFLHTSPIGKNVATWAKWHVCGTSASGIMWALPVVFLWPESSPEHYLIWAVCILPLSASAVSTYYTWKPSYISFTLLSVIPISLRFFTLGDLFYTILGILGFFYIAVLFQAGHLIHKSNLQTLLVGFRNEALNVFLSEKQLQQDELTQQLQDAHDQLKRISLTDELTGLWNRRYFNTTIEKYGTHACGECVRDDGKGANKRAQSNHIAFVMIDIDHFKAVNDTYGHVTGDKVLKQTSQLLIESCRENDTAIRWGGEEFLIISHNAQPQNHSALAERIRQAMETHHFDIGFESPLHLTCSVGTATLPFSATTTKDINWEKVVDLADACLFAAKHSGRNAWVSVLAPSIDIATNSKLTPDLIASIPQLVKNSQLQLNTSLQDNSLVKWNDDTVDHG